MIILVVGARPNFMKIAPIYSELSERGEELILLHTGQHYDKTLSDNIMKDFFLLIIISDSGTTTNFLNQELKHL